MNFIIISSFKHDIRRLSYLANFVTTQQIFILIDSKQKRQFSDFFFSSANSNHSDIADIVFIIKINWQMKQIKNWFLFNFTFHTRHCGNHTLFSTFCIHFFKSDSRIFSYRHWPRMNKSEKIECVLYLDLNRWEKKLFKIYTNIDESAGRFQGISNSTIWRWKICLRSTRINQFGRWTRKRISSVDSLVAQHFLNSSIVWKKKKTLCKSKNNSNSVLCYRRRISYTFFSLLDNLSYRWARVLSWKLWTVNIWNWGN